LVELHNRGDLDALIEAEEYLAEDAVIVRFGNRLVGRAAITEPYQATRRAFPNEKLHPELWG
jgi:hypothetical protein